MNFKDWPAAEDDTNCLQPKFSLISPEAINYFINLYLYLTLADLNRRTYELP